MANDDGLALTHGDFHAGAREAGHDEAYEGLCSSQTDDALEALNDGDFEQFSSVLGAWTRLGRVEIADVWAEFHDGPLADGGEDDDGEI